MLPEDTFSFTIEGAEEEEVNGTYELLRDTNGDLDILPENAGKPRFKHTTNDVYVWWHSNWHICKEADEDQAWAAGGDDAVMYYYWVSDHLSDFGGPEAAPDIPMHEGWSKAGDVIYPSLKLYVAEI